MNWLLVLQAILQLAVYFARRADRKDIEQAVLNELEKLHSGRVKKAADARDDVLAGRVPADDNDPNRRD